MELMISIIHIIESFAGGSLDVVKALARIKQTSQNKSITHIVIHGFRDDSPTDVRIGFDDDVKLISWAFASREISFIQDFRALYALLEILKQQPKDAILHLHSSKAGFLGRLAATILGRKKYTVYTPHSVAMLRQDVSLAKRQLYSVLEKLAALGSGTVVACSLSEQQLLKRLGIATRLVNNGIADPFLGGITPKTKLERVLAVGRLTPQKDPAYCESIAQQTHALGLYFTWVGDGELRSIFANSPVCVTGWLSQADVVEYLQINDVLISTSRWEGLSLATLQAMACGLPLLLRRCAGNIDLLEHQGIGAGFDTVEEAIAILDKWQKNPNLVKEMSEAVRQVFLKYYTVEAMQKGYLDIYQDIWSNDGWV